MKKVFFALLFLAAVVTTPMVYGQVATSPGPSGEQTLVTVAPGTSMRNISQELARRGIISNAMLFELVARISGEAPKLKAGEYVIPPQASNTEIIRILTSGNSVQHKITLVEGQTVAQIIAQINASDLLSGDVVVKPREGTLRPDTYFITRGDNRQDFVNRTSEAMEELVLRLWAARDEGLPFATPKEAIILASVVERETPLESEMPVVASVYINRLHKGMKLQADPTVIYGLSEGSGDLGRPLRLSDLKIDVPHNTYVHKGLPPTAIANPGMAAIEAVLRPASTPYFFFVADGTGGHVFAETFAEHKKNVAKWRAINANR